MTDPIRIGLIGAGIFTRDAHLPALLALQDRFHIVSIYSRTKDRAAERAAQCAAALPHPVEATDDLAGLLGRADIEAVAVVLPIDHLADTVDAALSAGKHVISEKPIAPTREAAEHLIARYADHPDQVWMVGENWRYEAAFEQAAWVVHTGGIGRVHTVNWTIHIAMLPDQNKYYATEWRRAGTFMGGFLLDGGVHHIAALRLIAGEIEAVAAFGASFRPDLPPADTLTAALRFASGAVGSYTVTFATAFNGPHPDLVVVGENGVLTAGRTRWAVTTPDSSTAQSVTSAAVEREYVAFADAIRRGMPHRNTPQSALTDLRVVEAMLHSWETGKVITL